jgi:hypothetical protein
VVANDRDKKQHLGLVLEIKISKNLKNATDNDHVAFCARFMFYMFEVVSFLYRT